MTHYRRGPIDFGGGLVIPGGWWFWVFMEVSRRIKDATDAEDLRQRVFLGLLEAHRAGRLRLEQGPASLREYLDKSIRFRVAGQIREYIRDRERFATIPPVSSSEDSTASADDDPRDGRLDRVGGLVPALPYEAEVGYLMRIEGESPEFAAQRAELMAALAAAKVPEILEEHYLQGMTLSELATKYGVSISAVHRRIGRGLRRCRKVFERLGYLEGRKKTRSVDLRVEGDESGQAVSDAL